MLRDPLGPGGKRDVRVVVAKIEEERPVAVVFDELFRACRALDFTLTALGGGRLRVGLAGEVDVEAVVGGQRATAAEVPLADTRRRIAGLPQSLGDRRCLPWQFLIDARVEQELRRRI